jgi:hypothetical protein
MFFGFADREPESAVFDEAPGACRNQRLEEKSASGWALWGRTLNQPLMPHASAMRPTSIASAGNSAASSAGNIAVPAA